MYTGKNLENKVAIVSGAGSGIGKAIALLYASEGAKIIVHDFNETNGNETVSNIKGHGGDAFFIKADLSKLLDNQSLIEQAVRHYGVSHITCW